MAQRPSEITDPLWSVDAGGMLGLSVIAILAVEPVAGRLWYTRVLRGVPADRRTR
jgi:hypothetical protein